MLSLCEKIEILDFCQNNGNVEIRVLADKFQVGKTQITDIVSNKDEIIKHGFKMEMTSINDESKEI